MESQIPDGKEIGVLLLDTLIDQNHTARAGDVVL